MRLFTTIILASFFVIGCSKIDVEPGTPRCMKKDILAFSKTDICPTGKKVDKFFFQQKRVYVFNPGSCDSNLTAEVKDSDCNYLGTIGGPNHDSIVNGEHFGTARYLSTAWEQ